MTELTCYRTVCTNERLWPSQIGTLVTVIVVVDECETVQAPRKHTLAINPITAAAIVLLSISTTLLEMLRAADNGGHFISPITKEPTYLVGYAYVDDTDLLQFDMRNNMITTRHTMEQMQMTINR